MRFLSPRFSLLLSLLCLSLGTTAWSNPSQAQELSLKGRWAMTEQFCVVPNRSPEKIAPGFPGARQDWVLEFLSDQEYFYSANYTGIMADDCRIESSGRYRSSTNDNGGLSSLRLTPSLTGLIRKGSFEPPCRVLTFEKSYLYEARMEPAPTRAGAPPFNRIRLRANDIFERCDRPKAKVEIVFEPVSPGTKANQDEPTE